MVYWSLPFCATARLPSSDLTGELERSTYRFVSTPSSSSTFRGRPSNGSLRGLWVEVEEGTYGVREAERALETSLGTAGQDLCIDGFEEAID